MQEPRARHSASSTATTTQPAFLRRRAARVARPRPHPPEPRSARPSSSGAVHPRASSSRRACWANKPMLSVLVQRGAELGKPLSDSAAATALPYRPGGHRFDPRWGHGGTRGHDWPRLASSAAIRRGADPFFRTHSGGLPLPCAFRGNLGPWNRRLRRRHRSRQGHRHASVARCVGFFLLLLFLSKTEMTLL